MIADVPTLVLEWANAPRNPAGMNHIPSPCLRYAHDLATGGVLQGDHLEAPAGVRAFSTGELLDLMAFPVATGVTYEAPPCVGYTKFPVKARVRA